MYIFSCSEEKHKLLYSGCYGDGNSESYNLIKEQYVIHNVQVQKKEYVGHAQKRLGTALGIFKEEKKGMSGEGKLTDNTIDKLQNYCGIANSGNSDSLPVMKSAIHASLFHCASVADRKLHLQHFPESANSWCGYKGSSQSHQLPQACGWSTLRCHC